MKKEFVNGMLAMAQMIRERARKAFDGTAAEAYVDTGVKILIAVVIGALLLAGLYALFNSVIMPKVKEKTEGRFEDTPEIGDYEIGG